MTHKSSITTSCMAVTFYLAFSQLVFAGIVTISDTNFVNTDWSLTTVQKNNGGTIISNQSAVITNSAPRLAAFSLRTVSAIKFLKRPDCRLLDNIIG